MLGDPFFEVPTEPDFKLLYDEIWKQRLELPEINEMIDRIEHDNPKCEFILDAVFGRNAFNRRQNIWIDNKERIIYSAGSVVVSIFEDENNKMV